MDAQTKAFQALKPICVALGDAAKSLSEGKVNAASVINHLERLKRTLTTYTAKPGSLHPKLADYVFFPISQVLRVSQKASIQCLELCLQCVSILVDQAWQDLLPPQTAAQLVILCTLLASKRPPGLPFGETTEELQSSAFWCLYHIFTVAGENEATKKLLTTEAHFPQLGQTISITLETIEETSQITSQAAASSSLEVLLSRVADREVHASFLPGILSKLTKTLTPSTKGRTGPQVLAQCINITILLLKSTLGHQAEESSLGQPQAAVGSSNSGATLINANWQSHAATQLKPALASILRLRSHGNADVKAMLASLCLTLLRECRQTLANCSTMALECLITIYANEQSDGFSIEFEMLLQADSSVARALQELLHEWLQSLATTMQSADEDLKLERMRQVRKSHELLAHAGLDMTAIDRAAAIALRDSVVVTLTVPGSQQPQRSYTTPIQSMNLAVLKNDKSVTEYESPLIKYKGQEKLMQAIHDYALSVVDHDASGDLRNGLERSLRQARGEDLIANFWLLLITSERTLLPRRDDTFLLNLPRKRCTPSNDGFDELYSFSLTVLTSGDEDVRDPRLQALALRALALRAQMEGEDFRFELVDALYPVLHVLATPDDMLQRSSITTLSMLSSACGYTSVKNLIVENVDYLVNAVALKLNAFDVSPQAPQVLLMMLRLAGPSLIPYLEDTVESIFAALEDYHGYPLLVELLFKVLGVMAEEGVKTPQLTVEACRDTAQAHDADDRWTPTTIPGLALQLRLLAQDLEEVTKQESVEREPHPERPWGNKSESAQADDADDLENEEQVQAQDDAKPTPPAPRTYGLLLKITELTQHFLPSASTSLRSSLLGLIRTTAPALAKHEDSFLPLINTIWPEMVSRLDDEEVHVIAGALDVVRVLCESAKDFMRTRITQLWPRLVEIHRTMIHDIVRSSMLHHSDKAGRPANATSIADSLRLDHALVQMEKDPSSYGDTSARHIWSALQALLPAIVQHVRMPPAYTDEALNMTASTLTREDTRAAFEAENSDALWLSFVKRRMHHSPVAPAELQDSQWGFAPIPA